MPINIFCYKISTNEYRLLSNNSSSHVRLKIPMKIDTCLITDAFGELKSNFHIYCVRSNLIRTFAKIARCVRITLNQFRAAGSWFPLDVTLRIPTVKLSIAICIWLTKSQTKNDIKTTSSTTIYWPYFLMTFNQL